MSWGLKIILTFAVFATGIITMVIISFSKDVDLVSDNYYEKEIKYQSQIDLMKNSNEINTNFFFEDTPDAVILKYSGYKGAGTVSGVIGFYRASDAKKDFKIELLLDSSGIQNIPKKNILKGNWKLSVDFNEAGENYYIERNILINK